MIQEQALKDRLQTIAREKELPFNSCWKQLLLERFLARLARSSHVNKFIFKGGFLLSYMMKIGRETVDLDFLLTRMHSEARGLQEVFEEIASIPSEDGFMFSFEEIELLSQPHMEYPGYRITFKASFAKMKDKIHVDVGVGDSVEPQNQELKFFEYRGKPLFEESISLSVYPMETIFAEKLETVLSKGSRNSRMKDFHDLFLMLNDKRLTPSKKLHKKIQKTFENRGTVLKSIQFDKAGYKALEQLWTAHLQGLGDIAKELNLPESITVIIERINSSINQFEIERIT
ncbi:nucleotidyl transferase AbiEii/AbiGii toxin family protein [Rhabdochlamydiaceae symbiont of Dictyostelium giganteum]|uniref:nucleotidyl transferase AbiEii/AbiGii toxin family protein n=1 Tax=Rhabdochlamydiaceae symbiont of Dictyostelium giganteum TaxID=3342349 RepID=UPI003850044E